LLQLDKRFPARFTPALPTTVPRADAATCPANVFKSTLKNLVLTSSSSTCIPVLGLTSSPSAGVSSLSPKSTFCDIAIGIRMTDINEKHFIFFFLV